MKDDKPGKGVKGDPFFRSPEELQQKIDEYLQDCPDKKEVVVRKGKEQTIVDLPCPTITGLALHCGFSSRQSFYDYENRPEFSYSIKRARTFIEREYEQILQTGNPTGAIFALKNFGWRDRQEVEHNLPIEQMDAYLEKMAKLRDGFKTGDE